MQSDRDPLCLHRFVTDFSGKFYKLQTFLEETWFWFGTKHPFFIPVEQRPHVLRIPHVSSGTSAKKNKESAASPVGGHAPLAVTHRRYVQQLLSSVRALQVCVDFLLP